jgi:hypothetical protein
MNKDTMDDNFFEAMSRLADDIFLFTEDEIDAELRDLGFDPDDVATNMKTLLGKAMLRHSSAHVISERKIAAPSVTATIIDFAPGAAKAKLEEIVNRDPEAFPELTMAARKGTSISDADARSQLEDLVSVGAIKIEDLQ